MSFSGGLRPVPGMSQRPQLPQWSVHSVVEAFNTSGRAKKSLQKLAEQGCDVGLIYGLLLAHTIAKQVGTGEVMHFAKVLEQARSLRESLRQTAALITDSLKVPHLQDFLAPIESFPGIVSLVPWLQAWADALDRLEQWQPELFDGRSAPSANEFIAIAHAEIEKSTGKDHYVDIANLLEAAYSACGTPDDANADAVRKLCDRHESSYRQLRNIVMNGAEGARQAMDDPSSAELKAALHQLCKS